jgi:hypothetical protein
LLLEEFGGKGTPDFSDPNEPHRLVADFRLPLYITTNYDDFLIKALRHVGAHDRKPSRAFCPWHLARMGKKLPSGSEIAEPSSETPLVYHLHGHFEDISSMVLTHDDYLDFLMVLSENRKLIPPRVEKALASTSLLFLGYSLEDMNFQVIFRRLAIYMQRAQAARHVAVQLAPRPGESTEEHMARAQKQQEYLERHYDLQRIKIFWGTCSEFAAKLRQHPAFPR